MFRRFGVERRKKRVSGERKKLNCEGGWKGMTINLVVEDNKWLEQFWVGTFSDLKMFNKFK